MSDMDKGEFIRGGYSVEPGEGGSFIVLRGGARHRDGHLLAEMRGFTDHSDMLEWLHEEHRILARDGTDGKAEPPKDSHA